MHKPIVKTVAKTLIVSLAYQLIFPLCSYALTTGPSQPEVQSFEPVGTTEMVNMFSGDFNYNIPLLDVDGYPVNISYHSGINMEQEASWVGLGWNINPGEINRTVRGLPDDFNGETIEKKINIEEENNVRVGGGGFLEIGGAAQLGIGAGIYINNNNYRGVSASTNVTLNAGIGGKNGNASMGAGVGLTIGVGSQTGADMDLSANVSASSTQSLGKDMGTAGASASLCGGTGFNSRTGLKDHSFGFGISSTVNPPGSELKNSAGKVVGDANKVSINNFSYGSTIPIGLQNYVPVSTNSSTLNTVQFQVKGGAEVVYTFPDLYFNASFSTLKYDQNGTKKGFGFLYSENAPEDNSAILDFSRDKDGIYNNTLPNLPPSSMTYDIYTVSGNGTGGMFRPFRNDIGTIYDPAISGGSTESQDIQTEFGIGDLFEVGSDLNFYDNELRAGPWQKMEFGGDTKGSIYEKAYFKQAGELTYNQQSEASTLFNSNPVYLKSDLATLIGKGGKSAGLLPQKFDGKSIYWDNNVVDRTTRANLLTFLTASQASQPEVAQYAQYQEFHNNTENGKYFDPAISSYNRYTTSDDQLQPQKDHISEFTQTLQDGRRYVYGIPAMNNVTREVMFGVSESQANIRNGMVKIKKNGVHNDDSENNDEGHDHFYSSTTTPAYAHSYLLTSVLSNDYVDVMGDGATDDDLGSFVKFNYTLVDKDYRWRAPYDKDSAQYNPGFWSNYNDGKGNYIVGSRQQWHLRSIESKNYIAEFYISPRLDGKGSDAAILPANSDLAKSSSVDYANTKSSASISYKLDSIKLYNKHDRYLNEDLAVPIKTVVFSYSYRLCGGTANSDAPSVNLNGTITHAKGKLTLERIYIRYGNSGKNLLSPYVFSYNNPNPDYDFAAKDRWGSYKPNNDPKLSNYEYPYTSQSGAGLDDSLSSWNLTDIKLPSGGNIHITYESDDYAYVQDRRSMTMFKIVGVGNSPKVQSRETLYDDETSVNDYIYFKRNKEREIQTLTPAQNYLEGQDLLYYSFNIDITGTGRFEHIKGYAKIQEVGYSDDDYGYVKVQREQVKNMSLHPATVYGLNIGRYYLSNIFYPGFPDGDKPGILNGLIAARDELKDMWRNPFKAFIKDGKGRRIKIAKSWIRLQTPGLTKKGGGVRVKRLELNDNWQQMSSSPNNASYGKVYDYTVKDGKYGVISSGVASYEPSIGNDENPFRRPIPYQAEAGRLLPSIDFFQEEPLGEGFFPAPEVGYSSVKVRSIHEGEGRSSKMEDEYLFYTAKDFPVSIDYTQKDAPGPKRTHTLRTDYQEENVLQGYALTFNDMHGKPREVNNYVLHENGAAITREKITGTKYNYQTTADGKLDNKVNAMYRRRGSVNEYLIGNVTLGKEMDLTVDSRQRYFRSFNRNVALNLNAVLWGVPPLAILVPIPTAFFPDKEQKQIFRTMVATKIIQQYGILQSVESYDHEAKTVTENILYDAETGSVLLTKTNNEFRDNSYNLKYPAYLAYEGMGNAYTNIGFEENVDSVVINQYQDGFIYTNNLARYVAGDELLVEMRGSKYKLWVTGVGYNTDTGQISSGVVTSMQAQTNSEFILLPPPGPPLRCALKVEPRYKRAYTAVAPSVNVGTWPLGRATFDTASVKILRSGKRNNLNANVQQTVLGKNPYANNIADLFGNTAANGNAFNQILAISVNTFKDSAQRYSGYDNSVDYLATLNGATGSHYVDFNSYVMGYRGNFRPADEYVLQGSRQYNIGHARYDGTTTLTSSFWTLFWNTSDCSMDRGIIKTTAFYPYWKKVKSTTKYDVYGNAVEEMNANGMYAAAIYGYNKAMPLAVGSNLKQEDLFFDGFEDYGMLLPEYLIRRNEPFSGLMQTQYCASPFGTAFNAFTGAYSNQSGFSTDIMIRAGQHFLTRTPAMLNYPNAGISTEENHTGTYSLKVTGATDFIMPLGYPDATANNGFYFANGMKYLADVWVKPFGGSDINTVVNQIAFKQGSMVAGNFVLKTGSIDGWYLLEATVVSFPGQLTLSLSVPANVYMDDIRAMKSTGNMKSFVYDPLTFKLMATLDENHFATLYEYDQEGLLVRVKKETDRGVLTVSESRRSNTKK